MPYFQHQANTPKEKRQSATAAIMAPGFWYHSMLIKSRGFVGLALVLVLVLLYVVDWWLKSLDSSQPKPYDRV